MIILLLSTINWLDIYIAHSCSNQLKSTVMQSLALRSPTKNNEKGMLETHQVAYILSFLSAPPLATPLLGSHQTHGESNALYTYPFGAQSTANTEPSWPGRSFSRRSLFERQSFMVLSSLAEMNILESGAHVRRYTGPTCPRKVRTNLDHSISS